MRDMMATHERLPADTSAAESVRRAAAAAFEALPALLLAAALLMPALAAFAGRAAERAVPADPTPTPASDVGRDIADQGNRALVEIRDQLDQGLRQNLTPPKLS